MIAENLELINARIAAACEQAGRPRDSVRLIAVSKTKPAEMVAEAYAAGQRLFGENHAQELTAKKPVLPDDIEWHFIGNLQRNKVKYVVGAAALIHSVNSAALAKEIDRVAGNRGLTQDVLAEINVGGEESKQGADADEARNLVEAIAALPHLRLRGLMTVAPPADDPETVRPVFRRLREMLAEYAPLTREPELFDQLSMGMTGDFEAAIEEGATCVRIGTAIFGAREYPAPAPQPPENAP
ncbi:MAG: YggS family pyridoxal phosphate-dependent enzyme [Lachnospiraceae bacterium]|nr:YggS family pyridoxal phosphate-dependent enzyme [Lachnospiraceae bacterium]